MKTNCWLILGIMVATTAVAQVGSNSLPAIPPPATAAPSAPAQATAAPEAKTNAPAKKTTRARHKSTKKETTKKSAEPRHSEKKADEAPVTLVAGPATVVAEHVNLRGQAGLKGEVVGHVQKGDAVTVISEINLDKPKAGEPAQWAKIALPAGTKVWVDTKYIDASNKQITARKLNLRGGPGENYSVLGIVDQGTTVTIVTNKGDWTQIEPPANAFAFMAASFLKQEPNVAPPTVANAETVPAPPVVPPTPTTVPEAQPIAPPANTPPPTPEVANTTPAAPPVVTPPPTPDTTTPPAVPQPTLAEEDTNLPPPPPRIVTHEGSVRHSVSLVAPTYFELYDPADNKAIDYLYTTSTNLNLSRYNGLHITVTGEEALDPRWKDTPVLTIQKIYVLSAGKPQADNPQMHPVNSK